MISTMRREDIEEEIKEKRGEVKREEGNEKRLFTKEEEERPNVNVGAEESNSTLCNFMENEKDTLSRKKANSVLDASSAVTMSERSLTAEGLASRLEDKNFIIKDSSSGMELSTADNRSSSIATHNSSCKRSNAIFGARKNNTPNSVEDKGSFLDETDGISSCTNDEETAMRWNEGGGAFPESPANVYSLSSTFPFVSSPVSPVSGDGGGGAAGCGGGGAAGCGGGGAAGGGGDGGVGCGGGSSKDGFANCRPFLSSKESCVSGSSAGNHADETKRAAPSVLPNDSSAHVASRAAPTGGAVHTSSNGSDAGVAFGVAEAVCGLEGENGAFGDSSRNANNAADICKPSSHAAANVLPAKDDFKPFKQTENDAATYQHSAFSPCQDSAHSATAKSTNDYSNDQSSDPEKADSYLSSPATHSSSNSTQLLYLDNMANLLTNNSRFLHQKVSPEHFCLLSVIGKGSYGKVMLVRYKVDNAVYAMKMLRKENIVKRNQVEHTKTERSVLEYINNPFIVQLYFAFQTPKKLYFVLEFCAGGELFFHLSRAGRFTEQRARFYSAEIICALEHLHKLNIVYRDLKPENVLLDSEGHIRLTDFGLSKEGIEDNFSAKSLCGTPEYLAPEILMQQGHGKAVDWWSLGALIYEMLTGLPPFYTRDREKLFENIRIGELNYPSFITNVAKSLLMSLFQRDPNKRLGGIRDAEEIKSHPFYQSIDWNSLVQKKVSPPFKPNVINQTDVQNFDKEFVTLPIYNSEVPETPLSRVAKDDMFQGFTYDGRKENSLCQYALAEND